MPKTRLATAIEVRAAFRAAEEAVEVAAAATAKCIAVLVEARRDAKLPPLAGAQVIALVGKGSQAALDARQNMLDAHPLLMELGKELKVISFGADGGCVPNSATIGTERVLRVVAAEG